MLRNVRKCLGLLDDRSTRRLFLLVFLALVLSGSEMVSALLIIAVFRPLAEPGADIALPLVGSLTGRFPDLPANSVYVGLVAFVGLVFVLRGCLYVVQTYAQQRLSQNVGVRLSQRLVAGYFSQPYEFHTSRNSADLIRRSLQSATTVGGVIVGSYVNVVSETLVVLALLGLLLVKAPEQTLLLALAVGPTVFAVTKSVQATLTRYGKRNLQHFKQALQYLQQGFEMVREIQVLGRGPYFERAFTTTRAEHARNIYLGSTVAEIPRAALEVTLIVTVLVFVAIAGMRPDERGESLSALALFGYTAFRILPAMSRIVTAVNRLRVSNASLDDVHEDLDLLARSGRKALQKSVPPLPFEDRIDLADVQYRYRADGSDVLRGITLRIGAGESIGIVGPTGAGKSTLIDLILGLLRPSDGEMRIDGVVLDDDNISAWQANIGLVPQTVVLLDDTLRRNIALGLPDDEIDEDLITQAVEAAQLHAVVEELENGLDTVVGERGVRLSGGQRQRVAIARALYRQPRVLVFDEGTSSLDTITEREVLAALERLHGERTLITVAHRLTTVRSCDLIYVINGGKVTDAGSYDELVQRSKQFREMAR